MSDHALTFAAAVSFGVLLVLDLISWPDDWFEWAAAIVLGLVVAGLVGIGLRERRAEGSCP